MSTRTLSSYQKRLGTIQLFGLPLALPYFKALSGLSGNSGHPKAALMNLQVSLETYATTTGPRQFSQLVNAATLLLSVQMFMALPCLRARNDHPKGVPHRPYIRHYVPTMRYSSVILYYYDMGGMYWPHDYFGAVSYWGYN